VQEGAVRVLIDVAADPSRELEARRYAVLALANLAATIGNHSAVIEDGGLQAMFALSNAADDLSQYYVAYALANLGSNPANHERIVEEGGLQPLIALGMCSVV
jgi:hypothetical protein